MSVTIEEIASQLGITKGTACSLVHDILVFHKISASWMPKHLTEGHKHNFQHICCGLLERCNHKGDNFLNCIITGDDTWVHHHEPETKWQYVQWKYSFFSSKKSKSCPSASKLLLAVFWDFQRHILKHYMVRGIMVISVNYCDILGNELRLTVCTQWRGRLSWVVLVCDRVHLTFSS